MSNELSDNEMIIKKVSGNIISFHIKNNIDIIWMSQKTLSSFFETPFNTIIQTLAIILTEPSIIKKNHIRSISYVKTQEKTPKSIQETQYSFTIICLMAFKLDTPIAKSFQKWVITSHINIIKNGFMINKKRIITSQKRLKRLKQQLKTLNNSLNDEQLL